MWHSNLILEYFHPYKKKATSDETVFFQYHSPSGSEGVMLALICISWMADINAFSMAVSVLYRSSPLAKWPLKAFAQHRFFFTSHLYKRQNEADIGTEYCPNTLKKECYKKKNWKIRMKTDELWVRRKYRSKGSEVEEQLQRQKSKIHAHWRNKPQSEWGILDLVEVIS